MVSGYVENPEYCMWNGNKDKDCWWRKSLWKNGGFRGVRSMVPFDS